MLFVVAPIVCWGLVLGLLFCFAVLIVLEYIACCFTLIVLLMILTVGALWLLCRCYRSFTLPRGAIGRSVVHACDCGIHTHLLFVSGSFLEKIGETYAFFQVCGVFLGQERLGKTCIVNLQRLHTGTSAIFLVNSILTPEGGGTLIFSSYVGSGPASTVHPPPPKKNIRNFKHPQKIFEI